MILKWYRLYFRDLNEQADLSPQPVQGDLLVVLKFDYRISLREFDSVMVALARKSLIELSNVEVHPFVRLIHDNNCVQLPEGFNGLSSAPKLILLLTGFR